MHPTKSAHPNSVGSLLSFEIKLWLAADKLRNNIGAAANKYLILDLKLIGFIGTNALAKSPFNDSDWLFDDGRWQPTGAISTVKGGPQGERGRIHQFSVPAKENVDFTWGRRFNSIF